jgi:hypothetical protein
MKVLEKLKERRIGGAELTTYAVPWMAITLLPLLAAALAMGLHYGWTLR